MRGLKSTGNLFLLASLCSPSEFCILRLRIFRFIYVGHRFWLIAIQKENGAVNQSLNVSNHDQCIEALFFS